MALAWLLEELSWGSSASFGRRLLKTATTSLQNGENKGKLQPDRAYSQD